MTFDQVTEAAYRELLQQGFADFPIRLSSYRCGDCLFLSYQQYSSLSGIPVQELRLQDALGDGYFIPSLRGRRLILYDGEKYPDRMNFTLAHEIGHLRLGHDRQGDRQEIEANFFAAQFLMPDAVLRQFVLLGYPLAEGTIRALFGVSRQAARKKADYLARFPLGHPNRLDGEVTARFLPAVRRRMEGLGAADEKNDLTLRQWEDSLLEP